MTTAADPEPTNGLGLTLYPKDANNRNISRSWGQIGFTPQNSSTGEGMGIFYATVNNQRRKYRVPTYDDFNTLNTAEYAYGVCYGAGATETKMNPDEAFGFINPTNDAETTPLGMRGIFVYNPDNANQIFFPIGKYGVGRRRMFNLSNTNKPSLSNSNATSPGELYWRGTLWYGDTNRPLDVSMGTNDWYRPMAYNVCYQQGAIYWIDKWVSRNITGTGSDCLGWDMNYYGFDFSPYTANNWQDACIIKLVVDE
ncbi:MAG: hypothetical protein HDS86_05590 [Bacteroidales bacterium]|nr:hypothetical protein [Bacteroidales bacterium]